MYTSDQIEQILGVCQEQAMVNTNDECNNIDCTIHLFIYHRQEPMYLSKRSAVSITR